MFGMTSTVELGPGDGPVTALAWNAAGSLLAWGTEGGEAGIVDLA